MNSKEMLGFYQIVYSSSDSSSKPRHIDSDENFTVYESYRDSSEKKVSTKCTILKYHDISPKTNRSAKKSNLLSSDEADHGGRRGGASEKNSLKK